MPRIVCVSEETAPNCCRSSRIVSANKSSGTGLPSLNRCGRRISYRRCKLFIGGRSFDGERNSCECERCQCLLRHKRLARRPGLEGESAGQETQRLPFGARIGKSNNNHI